VINEKYKLSCKKVTQIKSWKISSAGNMVILSHGMLKLLPNYTTSLSMCVQQHKEILKI
jgi:hypothetical protein